MISRPPNKAGGWICAAATYGTGEAEEGRESVALRHNLATLCAQDQHPTRVVQPTTFSSVIGLNAVTQLLSSLSSPSSFVQRLKSDSATELIPAIWSHVRQERSKKVED
ncbi:hypothetical protein J6590_048666 [Homalodisca vitripennis]|nr:hypothetical protein J6590_048666 [Homalodisca vitripennis]